jgi:hypothetical protein
LKITPQLVQLSEEAERELADQRMKVWSKDQEEYTEREFQRVEKLKQEQRESQVKVAVVPGLSAKELREAELERRNEEERAKFIAEQKKIVEARAGKDAEEADRVKRNSVVYARREKEAEDAEIALREEFRALLSPIIAKIEALKGRQAKINKLGKKAAGETKESEAAIATEKRELKQRRDTIRERMEEERESRKWYREQKWKEEDDEGTGLMKFGQVWLRH